MRDQVLVWENEVKGWSVRRARPRLRMARQLISSAPFFCAVRHARLLSAPSPPHPPHCSLTAPFPPHPFTLSIQLRTVPSTTSALRRPSPPLSALNAVKSTTHRRPHHSLRSAVNFSKLCPAPSHPHTAHRDGRICRRSHFFFFTCN